MIKTALIIVVLSLMTCLAMAEQDMKPSRKELYELQEKCKIAAQEFVHTRGFSASYFIDYQNHYNVKLNKCFIYIRQISFTDSVFWRHFLLYDANEHVVYENLTYYEPDYSEQKTYDVEEKQKRDLENAELRKEFEKRIKPYMTE
jgi:hypothetical protein